jgi:toxin ParE1/3/4
LTFFALSAYFIDIFDLFYIVLLILLVIPPLEDFETGKDIGKVKLGYRQAKIKSHLIIYKKADDDIIEIVRVLHQMMDIPNRL